MASSQAASKWIDPDAGEPAPRARVVREVVSRREEIDRFHNNESLSPEALSRALNELQTSMSALQERVQAVEDGAASVVGAAKGLGVGMLQLGDALSKRVSALEEGASTVAEAREPEPDAPPPVFTAAKAAPKGRRLRLTMMLGGAVAVAVAAIILLHPSLKPAAASPPAQVLYSPGPAGQ